MSIRIEYRKKSNRSLSLGDIRARKENGKLKLTRVVLDPILKNRGNGKIRNVIISHEKREGKLIVKGVPQNIAHKKARSKEPNWFKKIRSPKRLRKAVGFKY